MAEIMRAIENELRLIKRDYLELRKMKSETEKESILKDQLKSLAVIGRALMEIRQTISEFKVNRKYLVEIKSEKE